jgi:hypothetical protein
MEFAKFTGAALTRSRPALSFENTPCEALRIPSLLKLLLLSDASSDPVLHCRLSAFSFVWVPSDSSFCSFLTKMFALVNWCLFFLFPVDQAQSNRFVLVQLQLD